MKNIKNMKVDSLDFVMEYETPALYMLEACSEGVLCASFTNEGFIRDELKF